MVKNYQDSVWHLIIILTTIITAVYIPLRLIFSIGHNDFFAVFETVITILFAIDLIYYQTSLRRLRDHTLPHHQEIPLGQRLFWFLADFLAAIPFFWLPVSPYFSILRVLKLLRIAQYMHDWRLTTLKYSEYLKMVFFVFWLLLFSHYLACGWLALARELYKGDNVSTYVSSFYWVIESLTTVGYGEIIPTTNSQKIYAIMVMLTGVGVYGYIIGNVASILAKRDPAKTQYFDNLEQLNAFVRYRDIPATLQKRIKEYYAYIWKKRLGFDEMTFLSALPMGLRTEVELHLKCQVLDKIPLFQELDNSFIEEVALNLKPDVYTPGEFICKEGQESDKMFFVIKGELLVLRQDGSVINILKEGDFFGEIALLNNQLRSASVQAVTYCDLYILEKEVFIYLLERYPEIGAHIKKVAFERQQNNISSSQQSS
jgi:hypothetical protein